MDHIFFYDKNPDRLERMLPQILFDPQRSSKKYLIHDSKMLYKKMVGKKEPLLFYIEGAMNDVDRAILNSLAGRLDNLKVCLMSHEHHSMIAWEHNLFDFKKIPISIRNFKESYHKYSNSLGRVFNYIPIKNKEGMTKIPVRDINFLQAYEQFTFIHRTNGAKKIMISRNLKHFEMLLAGNWHLKRIHKSYMINTSNIRSIGKEDVHFYGNGETINPVSRELGRRIRKEILKK